MRIGRVRTRAGFAALAARGRRARRGLVRVTADVGVEGVVLPEVAFAVGRKVGTAVVRNRVRRRLRAAFAELAPPPGRYLLSVAPDAAEASYATLRDDLAAALAGAAVPVGRP